MLFSLYYLYFFLCLTTCILPGCSGELADYIRIVDIAKMAGVSVGTVDRVIHNRGRVSEENRKKVQAILEMVHYQPNLMARSLAASKKEYNLSNIIF